MTVNGAVVESICTKSNTKAVLPHELALAQ
jgi:hypothetical protein